MKSSNDRQLRKRCQTCLKHESGKRARKLHRGKPADSEVQSQVSKDGRIQQKDDASQGKKRRRSEKEATFSRKTDQHNSKAWDAAHIQCKREASRIRRAVASDRIANDIAKQVTMTRRREKVIRTCEEQ